MTTYGVISIATTQRYLDFWKNQVLSFMSSEIDMTKINFYLLTDNTSDALEFAKSNGFGVMCFEIPSYGWPDASLLRYREILHIKDKFSEDVLIYLDADMLVFEDFISTLSTQQWKNGVALVSHPGYWRPKGIEKINFYLRNPHRMLKDIAMKLRVGGLGSWELDSRSAAFVRREYRRHYVCGGTWMGRRNNFLELISSCSEAVDEDLKRNFIAKWHDESHLNFWSSSRDVTFLDPSYCFDPSYKHLRSLPEYIRAVEK